MTAIETVSDERLAETHKRLQEILDYFDEEANEALAGETERGDLWSDIEVPVADLRVLIAAARRAANTPVRDGWVPTPQQIHDYLRGLDAIERQILERAALSASPTLPSQVVGVKELVWSDDGVAETPFWDYFISRHADGHFRLARTGVHSSEWTEHPTLEALKVAAQADFNARIQSCITSPAAEAVGEPEERTLEAHCRGVMSKIYNRGHSGLEQDCPLCQAYIAADRLLSFETSAPLSEEVRIWDANHAPAAAVEIADAVLAWMVKHEFMDADLEYRDDDVIEVLDELITDPAPSASREVTEEQIEALYAAVDDHLKGFIAAAHIRAPITNRLRSVMRTALAALTLPERGM